MSHTKRNPPMAMAGFRDTSLGSGLRNARINAKATRNQSIFSGHYFEPHDDRPGLWVHICSDGSEIRYDTRPYKEKVLCVVNIGNGIEETRTANVGNLKRDHVSISCPPPGVGWWLHDPSDDKISVWRRVRP